MRDTGIEPVTSSVSGKRDIHLGKVVLYQLSYNRVSATF